jgi:hypothetical protein
MKSNGRNAVAPRPAQEIEVYNEGGELVEVRDAPGALEAVTRAQVDIQIATAKKYPRSVSQFMAKAKTLVSVDPDLAAQCTYYLPARSGKKDDPPITGPSVRLAEILAGCWKNFRVSGAIIDDDGKFLTAQAVAFDMEDNVAYSVEVRRGITTREGRRYSDAMVQTSGNAAISIAMRNATFKVIPRALVNLIEEEAQRVARGDVKSLPDRTARAVGFFVGKGVPERQIYEALGIRGPEDMTIELLAKLNGFKSAIADDLGKLDDIFAPKPEATSSIAVPGETQTEAVKRMLRPEATNTPKQAGEGP